MLGNNIVLRPFRPGDLAAVGVDVRAYGVADEALIPMPAYTGLLGETIVGVGGIGQIPSGAWEAWFALRPNCPYPRWVARVVWDALEAIADRWGLTRVQATAPENARKIRFLRFLGFHPEQRQDGTTLYVRTWRR
jgi:hypothetical protein